MNVLSAGPICEGTSCLPFAIFVLSPYIAGFVLLITLIFVTFRAAHKTTDPSRLKKIHIIQLGLVVTFILAITVIQIALRTQRNRELESAIKQAPFGVYVPSSNLKDTKLTTASYSSSFYQDFTFSLSGKYYISVTERQLSKIRDVEQSNCMFSGFEAQYACDLSELSSKFKLYKGRTAANGTNTLTDYYLTANTVRIQIETDAPAEVVGSFVKSLEARD